MIKAFMPYAVGRCRPDQEPSKDAKLRARFADKDDAIAWRDQLRERDRTGSRWFVLDTSVRGSPVVA